MPDRPFVLTTPLGDDVLLLYRMSVREELSRISEFQLECLSTRGDIDLDRILGKRVSVSMELAGDARRHFTGYVTRFAQVGSRGRYYSYHARVLPWFWFLTRTADCRIFQSMTVPDIIREVFADHQAIADFRDELSGQYRQWEYCVQYRETDFNFVSRLMEEEGIYYYFTYGDNANTLVLADAYGAHSAVEGCESLPYIPPDRLGRPEQEYVSHWYFEREVQPGKYVLDAFDFEKPSTELLVRTAVTRNYDQSDHEIFDPPGEYVTTGDGNQYVRVRMEELQTQFERAHGETNARGFAVGHLFRLTGFGRSDQNREYLVTAAGHDIQAPGYESEGGEGALYRCSFSAIESRQEFRPQRVTPKPIVQGPQTAIVTGPDGDEIHTDKYGRVKVQFHWDRYGERNENSSCWIRVSHPWAGKNWGAVAIPRIGQEVIVDFLEGDPDRPIITGRVYNAESMPPYTLPAGGVVSGIKSDTHKGDGYNEMSMDDTAGNEKITIHAQYDMNTTVEHDQTNTVKNTFTETITSHAKITVTEGTYSHDVQANTAKYHVSGDISEKYDSNQTTKVGQTILIVSEQANVSIKAATKIELEVGASKIYMDSGGKISVEGVNVAINGSTIVAIAGGVVHSEAKSEHQTKGAIVLSEGSATNTVKGGMVMLNP